MNSAKNNKTNQYNLNNNQSKLLLDISADLSVKSLYQILSKNPKLVNKVDDKGETLLTYSIKRKKMDVCQLIITSSVLDLSYQDANGNSYLHLAVIKQLEAIVKSLIEKGIYINMQNNDGNTPLHFAYLYDSIPIINILINNRIDRTIKNKDNKVAEDLKLYKDKNYYLEKDYRDKKSNKNSKSIKKNKDVKSNNPKGETNQKRISQLINNIETKKKTFSSNKKLKNTNSNISYNNSIKKILNKKITNKKNSSMKTNKNMICKTYAYSPRAEVRNEKNSKTRIIANRIITKGISPYKTDNVIKNEKSKQIIMNSNSQSQKNKKCKIDENILNKEIKYIDLGKYINNQEEYKTDLFKDKIKKIEGQKREEDKKGIINNVEDDIFNIAESIDYKQKLAHTSELNTQIVKSPVVTNKNKKIIIEDEYLYINDDMVNLTDKKKHNKKNKEVINDIKEKENEDTIEDDEDYNNDEDYYNEFKFEEGFHYNENDNENEKEKDNEEDNKYNEDEILAQNKSSLNLFENSVINTERQQKKTNNNEFQGRNYAEFSKNEDIEINPLTNEENKKMKTEINNENSDRMNPFHSTSNDNNYNKNINLNDRNNLTLNFLNTHSVNQRKTFTNRFYNNNQNDENLMKYGFNPYAKDNYNNYTNRINNNNIIFENLNFDNEYHPSEVQNNDIIHFNVNKPSNNYSVIPQSSSHVNNNTLDSVNEKKNYNPLKEFLSQINMLKYMNIFIQNGFDDIELIIDQAQKGIYIKDSELKEAGITIPGDRAKILIRIQEKAGNFGFTVPKNVYYVCQDLNTIELDENINLLNNWLKALKIEDYLMNFISNGYHTIELLLLQMESKNPLTVEILKNEIGIDKVGHRSRIINKLKDEGRSYNNKLKTSVLIVGNGEKNKFCECLIY